MASQGILLRNMALVGQTQGPTAMPAQHKPVFEEGCALSFGRWTALQLGVENEWGGSESRQKAQHLLEEVIAWFYSSKGQNSARRNI
jgi:pre-rRNA-processing protein TSR2